MENVPGSPRGWSSETHNGTGRPILAPLNHVRNDRDEGSAHRRILYPSKQHPSPRDTDSMLARREKKERRRKKKIESALNLDATRNYIAIKDRWETKSLVNVSGPKISSPRSVVRVLGTGRVREGCFRLQKRNH